MAVCGEGADFPERKGGSNPPMAETYTGGHPVQAVASHYPLEYEGGSARPPAVAEATLLGPKCIVSGSVWRALSGLWYSPHRAMSIHPAHYGGSPVA